MSDRIRTTSDAPWREAGTGLTVSAWSCALCSARSYDHSRRRRWRGLWVCVECAAKRKGKGG